MATLKLTSLHCVRQQDVMGKDEGRIVVDSKVAWNGVLDKGQTANLKPTSVEVGEVAKIVVQEMNGSKAKQIGPTAEIDIDHPGVQPLVFKTSGAHYELYYSIDR